ncbi:ABSCISIC ACID-INSENSITIVE 5-like protein 5 isoform X2 [Physcomitrium patens]|uniref:ABSCISIC ACID-INSENSITIVE 5-like protein 5 isoform X2 n=1 Tax=Physcomitrium patens TaxID=3218 RepID=UPI000D17077D|nr:ABSCISIC ACID-INSENSITIVE 5-like protein 5 isoform X2 [Physcomitrium patens]|eukprot:XP_024363128.1 ABSCISIC ACID-INSENSITIVE 5-like protein 5 isoform X2 [Physcomitrella patens]
MGANGASSSGVSNGLASSSLAGAGSRFNSLAPQSPIYSLTLDEFQTALSEPAKNLGSMNMDEFVKNIWSAVWTNDESQAMAEAMGPLGDAGQGSGELSRQPSLQKQGSISLPRTLSMKTVDEVWNDIHRGLSEQSEAGGEPVGGGSEQERTKTFKKMTLEDFLVKAGVVMEDSEAATQGFSSFMGGAGNQEKSRIAHGGRAGEIVPTLSLSPANVMTSQATIGSMQIDAYNKNQAAGTQQQQQQQADWLRSIAQQQAAAEAAYANVAAKRMGNGAGPMVGMGGLRMGGAIGPSMGPGMGGAMTGGGLGLGLGGGMTANMGMGANSPPSPDSDGGRSGLSLSPIQYGADGSVRGRKRGSDGAVEKVVERRQRRMIKNRESAARSRARKQAYTVELEAEVSQLKEENMRLRKHQEEEAERRRKQCLQITEILQSATKVAGVEKAKGLRRTRTATW